MAYHLQVVRENIDKRDTVGIGAKASVGVADMVYPTPGCDEPPSSSSSSLPPSPVKRGIIVPNCF